MKYLSSREKKKLIREEIKKELNLNNRDVGVSRDILIKVKSENALKKIEEIKKIAFKQQYIRRDKYSMEILKGGNTFVRINIEKSAYKNEIENAVELLKKLVTKKGRGVNIRGIKYVIPTGQMKNQEAVWIEKNENDISERVFLYDGFLKNNPTVTILAHYLVRN